MKALNTYSNAAYHDLIDYNVVDRNHDHVGNLHSLWTDATTGQLEFLGVKTGWLFGSNHVVPVKTAQIDEENRLIQVGYDAAFIKDAPSIPADAEITEEQETEIHRYYSTTTGGSVARRETETRSATMATNTAATTGAATAAATTSAAATAREARTGENIEVPLTEEEVKVGKRMVETGNVRLRKVVRTEVVNQPVELRREEVVVERVPAGEVTAKDARAFDQEEIVVPVRHEEAVVSKEAHVTGAVRVRKTEDVEQQTVSETVRKEDVEVDRNVETTTRRDTDDRTRR